MLTIYVFVQSFAVVPSRVAVLPPRRPRDERGQASAEYALVLLGAAALALLVTGWAARTDRVGRLLDAVMDQLLSRAK